MILILMLAATLTSQAIRLENGPVPVEQAFNLKNTMGEAAFAAGVEAAVTRLHERADTTARCETAAESAAAAEFQLVRRTDNPEGFAKARAAAEAALAQRRALRPQYLDGAPAPPPYGLVSRMAAKAKADPNPRMAQLYRRMAEDQFSRIDSEDLKAFFGPGAHTTWEQGLDEGGLAYVDESVVLEWCPNDLANTAWLKADIRDHGWYKISVYGADADTAAWSLVQHGRQDLAFEDQVLAALEPLWQSGETKGSNYTMLYDQVAQYHKRPGRFGLTGDCTSAGVWTPAPMEGDRQATDAWRAKAGLPPLAEYLATRARGCTD